MLTPFKEEQRFTQWYVWMILGAASLIPLIGIIQQIILGNPFGENPMSDTGLIILAVVLVLPLILFAALRMVTTIDEEGVSVDYFPILRRRYDWDEIESAELLDYGFVGGYGIRMGSKYGTVYNVKGKYGLWLKMKDGRKVMVGTQKIEELRQFLREMGKIDLLDLDELAPRLEELKEKKKRLF